MVKLHPQVLERDGKRQFVILPYEEFVELQERLADAEDLADLNKAKEESAGETPIPFDEAKQRLGMDE